MTRGNIFSGEPLPVAPSVGDPEIAAFNRKLLDYLRRLQGRLDQLIDVGPSLEIFSAVLSADHTVTSTEEPILWTTVLRQDTPYALQAGEDEIRLLQDGFYIILVDVLSSPSANFNLELSTWIFDGGSPDYRVDYGEGIAGEDGTISMAIPLPIEKNLGVGIYAKMQSGTGAYILAAGTRITIVRLFDDFSGGTSKNPGTGWDPNTPGGGVGTTDGPS